VNHFNLGSLKDGEKEIGGGEGIRGLFYILPEAEKEGKGGKKKRSGRWRIPKLNSELDPARCVAPKREGGERRAREGTPESDTAACVKSSILQEGGREEKKTEKEGRETMITHATEWKKEKEKKGGG